MKKDNKTLIRGIGIGMIITASLFYFLTILSPELSKPQIITDQEIMSKAEELGMVLLVTDEAMDKNESSAGYETDVLENNNAEAVPEEDATYESE